MTIFFTSDTHFNHANIIGYCKRPYLSVEHMNAVLIHNWNKTVEPGDTVFHLGDFALGKQEDAPTVFDMLNGEKHLIAGNHDGTKVKRMAWKSVMPVNIMLDEEIIPKIIMIHNPDALKPNMAPALVLHGHLHGMSDLHPFTKHPHMKYIDVGVDCMDYKPVSLDAIRLLAA